MREWCSTRRDASYQAGMLRRSVRMLAWEISKDVEAYAAWLVLWDASPFHSGEV